MLLPSSSFGASWFIDGSLIPFLKKFFQAGWNAGRRKPGVYIDNAPADRSRMIPNFFGTTL
jgi:hypothetical protein